MDLELRHLRSIVAVADERHFTRAAERLGITQPALSQQIRRIEDTLGVALFQRTSRRVNVTEAGQVIVDESKRALAQVDRTLEVARRASRGDVGHLAIGFLASATAGVLPAAVQALRTQFPLVRLTLEERPDSEQLDALAHGRLDVGFLRTHEAMQRQDLHAEVIATEPFAAVLPEHHPLAHRPEIALSELAEDSFIFWPREMAAAPYDELISACWRQGFSPRIEEEALNAHTVLAFVGAGLGVSILALSFQHLNYWGGVTFVPIRDIYTDLLLAWRQSNTSPVLASFLDVTRALVRQERAQMGLSHPARNAVP